MAPEIARRLCIGCSTISTIRAANIRKLPELAAAVTKALAKAKELGLLADDEAGE